MQRVAAPNRTGLPDNLKAGVESLSGLSLDHVRVHRNSSRPAQLNAHAYAQGGDIHLAPAQEKHLPHEAWHVVQQAQGRVKPTMQMKKGVPINDDAGLEHEADVMGAKAVSARAGKTKSPEGQPEAVQRAQDKNGTPENQSRNRARPKRALDQSIDNEALQFMADGAAIHAGMSGPRPSHPISNAGNYRFSTAAAAGRTPSHYFFDGTNWQRVRTQHRDGPTLTSAAPRQQHFFTSQAALNSMSAYVGVNANPAGFPITLNPNHQAALEAHFAANNSLTTFTPVSQPALNPAHTAALEAHMGANGGSLATFSPGTGDPVLSAAHTTALEAHFATNNSLTTFTPGSQPALNPAHTAAAEVYMRANGGSLTGFGQAPANAPFAGAFHGEWNPNGSNPRSYHYSGGTIQIAPPIAADVDHMVLALEAQDSQHPGHSHHPTPGGYPRDLTTDAVQLKGVQK